MVYWLQNIFSSFIQIWSPCCRLDWDVNIYANNASSLFEREQFSPTLNYAWEAQVFVSRIAFGTWCEFKTYNREKNDVLFERLKQKTVIITKHGYYILNDNKPDEKIA